MNTLRSRLFLNSLFLMPLYLLDLVPSPHMTSLFRPVVSIKKDLRMVYEIDGNMYIITDSEE